MWAFHLLSLDKFGPFTDLLAHLIVMGDLKYDL